MGCRRPPHHFRWRTAHPLRTDRRVHDDISFVVDSYSIGFGFNYKATDRLTLKAAYFQTMYDTYDRLTSTEPLVSDSFTRTNRVLGIGCEVSL